MCVLFKMGVLFVFYPRLVFKYVFYMCFLRGIQTQIFNSVFNRSVFRKRKELFSKCNFKTCILTVV